MFFSMEMIVRYLAVVIVLFVSACGGGTDSNEEQLSYSVSTSLDPKGSFVPENQSVASGEAASFSVSAVEGYQLNEVTGCAGSLDGDIYTTGTITNDCTVSASFSQITNLNVTTQAGLNGALSGSSVVNWGDTVMITVTPDVSYEIDTVTGCNGTLNGTTYTTGAITADCTVSASFSQITNLNVTTQAGLNGALSGSSVVNWGDTVMITVTPDVSYGIDTVTGCNGTLNGTTYTTGPITADCTVSASFSQITYLTVTTQAGLNGIISGSSVVSSGDTVMITVTPDVNYGIDTVTGCNGTLNGTTYTTGAITADCTVSAGFAFELPPVTPLYGVNGVNWNDYIKNDGVDVLSATDAAADGTETGGYSSIIHGGELRKTQAIGKTSCAGLTAQDELNAFEWLCVNTTNPVTMISSGLKQGKYLSDLIDFETGSWKKNRVTIYENSTEFAKTPSEIWWSNPVIIDNDGSDGSDMAAGDIRIVTVDAAASYSLTQNKIAFVTGPNVTLQSDSSFPEVVSNNNKYIWIEGNFTTKSASRLTGTDFSVVQNINVNNCSGDGVALYDSHFNYINNISVEDCSSDAVLLSGSSNNTVRQVRATGKNFARGVVIGLGANDNTISNVTAFDLYSGIVLGENSGNHISKVYVSKSTYAVDLKLSAGVNTLSELSLFNSYTGVNFDRNAEDYVITQLTAANNYIGVYYDNAASSNVVMQVTAANSSLSLYSDISSSNPADILNNTIVSMTASNNNFGLRLYYLFSSIYYSNINATISNYVGADNNYGIWLSRATGNFFTGIWKLGNNSLKTCLLEFLSVTDGMLEDCTPLAPSDFSLTLDITTQNSFVGKVSGNDSFNLSDLNGSASFPVVGASFDWVNFENFYRGWGVDGSVFPNADQRLRWDNANAGAGRIWDWSLKSTDTVLRNVLSLPTGNDTLTHTWGDATTTTFLRNAVEIAQDGVGNDNGLCESNETCLFTPNIASYQGHGDLISAGSFSGGALTGVTLVKYSINGR